MAPFMVVFSYISRVIFWDFAEDDSEKFKSTYFTSEFWLRHKPARCAHPSFQAFFTFPIELCALLRPQQLYREKHHENKNGLSTMNVLRTGYSTEVLARQLQIRFLEITIWQLESPIMGENPRSSAAVLVKERQSASQSQGVKVSLSFEPIKQRQSKNDRVPDLESQLGVLCS